MDVVVSYKCSVKMITLYVHRFEYFEFIILMKIERHFCRLFTLFLITNILQNEVCTSKSSRYHIIIFFLHVLDY